MLLSDAYPFHYLQREYPEDEGLLYVDLYHFKSTKSHLWYIVRVECYECHIYGVKFFQKNHRLSKDKYKLMSNTFEPRRIVNTDKSTYMLINNAFWAEHPNLVDDIESFFTERYDYFD